MKNTDFENLMSMQVIDTETAKILGDYYIEGKYTDFKLGIGTIFIVLIALFIINIFNK